MNNNHNGDMRGNNRSPFNMNQNYSPYNNDGPMRNNSNNVHCVHMRGLPFKATQNDIADVSFAIKQICLSYFISLNFIVTVLQASVTNEHLFIARSHWQSVR